MSSPSGTNSGGIGPSENLSRRSGGGRRGPMMTAAGVGVVIAVAIIAVIAGWAVGYYTAPSSSNNKNAVTITETGSSLLYPLMASYWAPNYTKLAGTPIALSTASTGSGTGQSYAEAGLVDIGASDAYLSNASATNLVNIPVAISSQLVFYNLPGVTAHLNINGTVLGMIYNGNIVNWNDPMIQAANPGVALPNAAIVPLARSDGSGDTFLITSYMYMAWAGWATHGYSTAKLSGTLNSKIQYANGNAGLVTLAAGTPNSITYIGNSYRAASIADGLVAAALGNSNANTAAGGVNPNNYLLWSSGNVSQDANLALTRLNYASYGLALSLIMGGSPYGPTTLHAGGGGTAPTAAYPSPYPDVNLEYTLIKATGSAQGPSHQYYVVQFLYWALGVGNQPVYLSPLGFLPLTSNVVALTYQTLQTVQVSN